MTSHELPRLPDDDPTAPRPFNTLTWKPAEHPVESARWLEGNLRNRFWIYSTLLDQQFNRMIELMPGRLSPYDRPHYLQEYANAKKPIEDEARFLSDHIEMIGELDVINGLSVLNFLAGYRLGGVHIENYMHDKILRLNEDGFETVYFKTLSKILEKHAVDEPWSDDELGGIRAIISTATSPQMRYYYNSPRRNRDEMIHRYTEIFTKHSLAQELTPFLDWEVQAQQTKPQLSPRNYFREDTDPSILTDGVEIGRFTVTGGSEKKGKKADNEDSHRISEYFIPADDTDPTIAGHYIIHMTVADGITTSPHGAEDSAILVDALHERPRLSQQKLDTGVLVGNTRMEYHASYIGEYQGTTVATVVIDLTIGKDGTVLKNEMIRGAIGDTRISVIKDDYNLVSTDHTIEDGGSALHTAVQGFEWGPEDLENDRIPGYKNDPQNPDPPVKAGDVWGIMCDGVVIKTTEIRDIIKNSNTLQQAAETITQASIEKYLEKSKRWDDTTIILVKIPERIDLKWLADLLQVEAA